MAQRSEVAQRLDNELSGRAAPPRSNGELVFKAPWEGRAFGVAVALCEKGLYTWDEFRDHLIEEIGRWDRAHGGSQDPDPHYNYYERWLAALEGLLLEKRMVKSEELAERMVRQAREDGHH